MKAIVFMFCSMLLCKAVIFSQLGKKYLPVRKKSALKNELSTEGYVYLLLAGIYRVSDGHFGMP